MGLSTFDETFAVVAASHIDDTVSAGSVLVTDGGQRSLRIDSLLVTTDETSDHILQLCLINNGVVWPLGSATLAAGAGNVGILPLDLVATCVPASMVGIVLGPGWALGYILDSALSLGRYISAVAFGGIV